MIAPTELAVFVKLVSHCFSTLSGSEPVIGTASIELDLPKLSNYSGFIQLQGPLNGWIGLSIPSDLADGLLDELKDPNHNDETRLDLAGEIASTVAANAREHFGERLLVHPALITSNGRLAPSLVQPPMVLQIPFTWRDHNAQLLIGVIG
jgi:chemotaxis protein CheX